MNSRSFWLARNLVACSAIATASNTNVHIEHNKQLSNWSGNVTQNAATVFYPKTESALIDIVRDLSSKNQRFRIMGSGLSPNGLSLGSGRIISVEHLNGIQIDAECLTVEVGAGTLVGELVSELQEAGLTLPNLASISSQQMAGLTQVGAHGTGARIAPLDEAVVGVRLVKADGTLCIISNVEEDNTLLNVIRCSVGSLGVVSSLTLKCVRSHNLKEHTYVMTRKEVKDSHKIRLQNNRHVRYMWIPYCDSVVVVVSNITTDAPKASPAVEPISMINLARRFGIQCSSSESFADMRSKILSEYPGDLEVTKQVNQAESEYWKLASSCRVGSSDDILGFDCGGKQLVYEVAMECGKLCTKGTKDVEFVLELLKVIEADEIAAPSPIEQRWTCGSSSHLNPAFSKDAENELFSWVGIIMYLNSDGVGHDLVAAEFDRYRECLQRVSQCSYKVKPHWAKINLDRETISSLHAKCPMEQLLAVKHQLDPRNLIDSPITNVLLQQSSH